MILALEGNDGVGKSTAAAALAVHFAFPVFADPVRHGLLGELSTRDMFVAGNQSNLDLCCFARHLNFVADRWALSSVVYDGLRGIPGTDYTELLQLYVKAPVHVLLLDLPAAVAHARVVARDGEERRPLEEAKQIRVAYLDLARAWTLLGGRLTVLDAGAFDLIPQLQRAAQLALRGV